MKLNLKHLDRAFVNCPFIKNSSGIYLTTLHRLKQILVNTRRQSQMPANCTSIPQLIRRYIMQSSIKLAVITALGVLSSPVLATGFVNIPSTGFTVSGGTSAYTLCNTTGNFGSGSGANAPVRPTTSANNTCAVFPSRESKAPDANYTGLDADPATSTSQPIVMTNTYTGGNPITVGTLTQYVWQRSTGSGTYECIYGTKIVMSNTDYNTGLSGSQHFEVNDVAFGGFSGLTVDAAYATIATVAEPVYRIGRAFTAVQHRASGYAAQPLTGLGSNPSINGLNSWPGTASSTQQQADIDVNWIDFTTDVNYLDDDGSTSAASGMMYLRTSCSSPLPSTPTTNAIRLRQTFQEPAGGGGDNPFIEVAVPGFLPGSGSGSVAPAPTSPY